MNAEIKQTIEKLTNVLVVKMRTQPGYVDGKIPSTALPALVLEGMIFLKDEVKIGETRKKILLDVLTNLVPIIIVAADVDYAAKMMTNIIPVLIDTLAFTSKTKLALTTSGCGCC